MKIRSNRIKYITPGILAVILAVGMTLSVFPAHGVQASNGAPITMILEEEVPAPDGNPVRGTKLLEKALKREQKVNKNLAEALDKADRVISHLEEIITDGKTDNRNVSALENTLEELKEQTTSARSIVDKAASLLADPAGFNTSGQVSDLKLAGETVREIHRLHQQARQLIGDSIRDAVKAIRIFRQDNPVK